MKNKFKLTVYPLLIFTAAILTAGAVRSLSIEEKGMKTSSAGMIQYDALESYEGYDFESSDTINVVFNGESVSVLENYRYEEPAYILTVNGSDRYLTGTQFYSRNGSNIYIEYDRPYGILEIILPKDYRYSGLNIKAPQANISFRNMDTEFIKAETASGSISCDSIISEKIELKSTGGNIYISDTDSSVIQLSTRTGNINARAACSECYIQSISGDIIFDPDELNVRADLTSDSGYIRFTASVLSDTSVNIFECGELRYISPEYVKGEYNTYKIGEALVNVNIDSEKGTVTLESK